MHHSGWRWKSRNFPQAYRPVFITQNVLHEDKTTVYMMVRRLPPMHRYVAFVSTYNHGQR